MAVQMKYLAATGGAAELHALAVYICILHSRSLYSCVRLQPRADGAKSRPPFPHARARARAYVWSSGLPTSRAVHSA
eukprot:13322339-Alexandrium_andersonii.AAC.1